MANDNLVLSLRKPATLYLGSQGNNDGIVMLGEVRASSGFPPWPTSADLLATRETRELCGVTYQVGDEHRNAVREMVRSLDACVRYIDETESPRRAPYADEPEALNYLEITWSVVRPDVVLLAQLGGDVWYYRQDELTEGSCLAVVGYGLPELQELLGEYDLRLPRDFSLPMTLQVREVRPTETSK